MKRRSSYTPAMGAGRRGMALAAVAALGLAACGGNSSGGPKSAVKAPTDHVLHLSFLTDPGQPPDPDVYYAGQGLLLTTNIYEGLLAYKPGTATPEVVPSLATSWTVSPDKKVYTLKLRQGVTFHDGTAFTPDAVKTAFDRRTAVNQGPAYMVSDVASVTTTGTDGVVITLKQPNPIFLDYLASAYGPKMMSPTGLKANAGKDNAQTYLLNHDLGTGPYTLTDAKVGSHYALKSYPGYWGAKPYFTSVDIPVLQDTSTQQLQFEKGELASIIHDLPASAVKSYLANKNISTYSLGTQMSDYLYINPNLGFLKDKAARNALQQSIDIQALFKSAYFGRGKAAANIYPPHMVADTLSPQNLTLDNSKLKAIASGLSADDKSIVIGYDSVSPDNQLVANLIGTQLAAAGLTPKVQAFPTSQIFGWITDPKGAPSLLATLAWPDAAPAYTWAHITFDKGAGLNYLNCSDPKIGSLLAQGVTTADPATFGEIGKAALDTGCWMNLVDQDDFVVAQPWLKGVVQAHVVTQPNSLSLAALSVG